MPLETQIELKYTHDNVLFNCHIHLNTTDGMKLAPLGWKVTGQMLVLI